MSKITSPREGSKLLDSEIITNVAKELKMTKHKLAATLQTKSHAGIYNIFYGTGAITGDMINRFSLYLPQVNQEYLKSGKLPIIHKPVTFEIEEVREIKDQLNRIEEMLITLIQK